VDFTLTDANGALSVLDAASSTCDDAGANTDGLGQCTIVFTSNAAGTVTGHASTTLTIDGVLLSRNTNGVAPNSDDAVKTFVDAFITIDPDGTNPVGAPHTFTVTLWKNLGLGGGFVVADGEDVDFTLTDSLGAVSVLDAVSSTCDDAGNNTDTNGQCTIVFTSNTAGTVTGHASSALTVGGVLLFRETDGIALNSDDAVKDFVEGGICLVVIDEEGVDNDFRYIERAAQVISDDGFDITPGELINDEHNFFWDDVPSEDVNRTFPWNLLVDLGFVAPGIPPAGADLVLLPTGQVDDEGWYNLPEGPQILYKDNSRPPNCIYGPGQAGYDAWIAAFIAGTVPQHCLDEVLDVMPLRNQDLAQLVGEECVAVVYDSDISINYEPLFGNLQGERYGLFHFRVETLEVAGSIPENKSDTDFYGLWLRVLGEPPTGAAPLDFVVIRDHEPDSIEINRARCRNNVLDVIGESDFAPGAVMTVSVDGPDAGLNPAVDPFLIEEPMTYIGRGRYRLQFDMSTVPETCSDLNGRRLSIQTDEGGAYNSRIRN
jgi:hypothetical protein